MQDFQQSFPLDELWTLTIDTTSRFDPGLEAAIKPPLKIALTPPTGTVEHSDYAATGRAERRQVADCPVRRNRRERPAGQFDKFRRRHHRHVECEFRRRNRRYLGAVRGHRRPAEYRHVREPTVFWSDVTSGTPIQATFALCRYMGARHRPACHRRRATGNRFAAAYRSRSGHHRDDLCNRRRRKQRAYAGAFRGTRGHARPDPGIGGPRWRHRRTVFSVGRRQSGTGQSRHRLQAASDGLGLEIDAGPASGGGYISFDPSKGQYAGGIAGRLSARRGAGQVHRRHRYDHAGWIERIFLHSDHHLRSAADRTWFRFYPERCRRPWRCQPHHQHQRRCKRVSLRTR